MTGQPTKGQRTVGIWLLSGYAMVIIMVVLGGVTRLTQSGLSIVEWNVIMGTIPPMTASGWETAFDQYKQFPEYEILNAQMTLDEFKSIFWWEYIHRLWGRLIGFVFIIPFAVFLVRKQLSPRILRRSLLAFFLGAFQGAIGWYMVQSGLLDVPHVSHVRLTFHLLLALTISGVLLWTFLGVWWPGVRSAEVALGRRVGLALALVVGQIAIGGLVAGLQAGYMYNTYPLMGDSWLPESAWMMPNTLQNFVENGVMVQFIHRWMAWLAAAGVIAAWIFTRRTATSPPLRRTMFLSVVTVIVQIALGILTLWYAVPVVLGVAHQAVAFLLFSLLVVALYQARHAREVA